jgi:NTP pyrophosphatase (non-canonical NTP hydrolase)
MARRQPAVVVELSPHPKAVICGSFRRDPELLASEFRRLSDAGCTILSPVDTNFVTEVDGFVYGQADIGRTAAAVEQRHLGAMQSADFVWLHCPGGYVGTSAAMELGFAQALGLRVFASQPPENVTMRDIVHVCRSPEVAVQLSRLRDEAPSRALPALQAYYARAARERGWDGESAATTAGLLRGELDELEAALAGSPDGEEEPALELADVLLYVVHLANILGLDLGEAVRDKERINSERFDRVPERLAA